MVFLRYFVFIFVHTFFSIIILNLMVFLRFFVYFFYNPCAPPLGIQVSSSHSNDLLIKMDFLGFARNLPESLAIARKTRVLGVFKGGSPPLFDNHKRDSVSLWNYWDMPDHKDQMGAIYGKTQFEPFLYHGHFLAIMPVCVLITSTT